ncbi:hypothetical protein [Pseudodesulfovibrio piezophilus]|uniref:Uncharacterized protein n=1 Tax=Pseudodesulfovibrio piezophilus (strain DSM 21447 / JCM 15486 / C1TLV30) TaxID=1322246 RepID=M1WPM2_PSEP2|nr:hypothetical protein [Pseudodesulfovibrio piezophilus]CCH48449.1 protein of unknown function [Pseudodesulfovibrio piezophilus C1TLV30]
MKKNTPVLSDTEEVLTQSPEIDYEPKPLSLRNQIIWTVKITAIAALFFAILWVCES